MVDGDRRGKNGSVVQLLHPDHGWLTFLFPPECASRLGTQLVKHSALCDYFAGTLPPQEIAGWLQAADVFALATHREGCCNAVLEALACGIPVVTTPAGDNAVVV